MSMDEMMEAPPTHEFPTYVLDAAQNRVKIVSRVPYEMPGELTMTSQQAPQQYAAATFMVQAAMPFEIHEIVPRIYAFDDEGVMLPEISEQQLALMGLVRLTLVDLNRTQNLTKAATLISTLVDRNSLKWTWRKPYTLLNNAQIQATIETLAFPAFTGDVTPTSLLVALTFKGYLINVGRSNIAV